MASERQSAGEGGADRGEVAIDGRKTSVRERRMNTAAIKILFLFGEK
jgi:hypothetical protein